MNIKMKNFLAAFAVTGILVGALCGFAAVDLSTDRYMPGRFGSFFEITGIRTESVEFDFLAKHYEASLSLPDETRSLIKKFRGLLPTAPQIFSSLAADSAMAVLKRLPQMEDSR